jgi:hypothetical protein
MAMPLELGVIYPLVSKTQAMACHCDVFASSTVLYKDSAIELLIPEVSIPKFDVGVGNTLLIPSGFLIG